MIKYEEDVICPHCSGSGEGQHDGTTCTHCKGSGVETIESEEQGYDSIHDELPDEYYKYGDFDNDTLY